MVDQIAMEEWHKVWVLRMFVTLGGKLVVDGEGRCPSPKRISNPIMGNKERVADNIQMGFLEAHF